MRTKAEKLEKGKWYADNKNACSFLKFDSYGEDGSQLFSDSIYCKGCEYVKNRGEFIQFGIDWDRFIPTPEDIEKYGLIDDEI